MLKLFASTGARIVTVVLILQAILLYSSIRPENIPTARPLSELPKEMGSWHQTNEGVTTADIEEVLKADDTLNRGYTDSRGIEANLWVASFRSQRNGKAPHSPKNCLPGSGWTPIVNDQVTLTPPDSAPIVVNRYIVEHGTQRSMVLYWYQSRDRVVASEYTAKFWVVADAIRLNRTDTALVRVIVPLIDNNQDAALKLASDFINSFYQQLHQYLPA
jgi:EpsI family protein